MSISNDYIHIEYVSAIISKLQRKFITGLVEFTLYSLCKLINGLMSAKGVLQAKIFSVSSKQQRTHLHSQSPSLVDLTAVPTSVRGILEIDFDI